jgi:hypothetical protein
LQVLSSRRFQHGFDRVNLHRPTICSAMPMKRLLKMDSCTALGPML